MKKQAKPVEDVVSVCDFFIVKRKSKKGNEFKALVCLDENEKEHFICYIH